MKLQHLYLNFIFLELLLVVYAVIYMGAVVVLYPYQFIYDYVLLESGDSFARRLAYSQHNPDEFRNFGIVENSLKDEGRNYMCEINMGHGYYMSLIITKTPVAFVSFAGLRDEDIVVNENGERKSKCEQKEIHQLTVEEWIELSYQFEEGVGFKLIPNYPNRFLGKWVVPNTYNLVLCCMPTIYMFNLIIFFIVVADYFKIVQRSQKFIRTKFKSKDSDN